MFEDCRTTVTPSSHHDAIWLRISRQIPPNSSMWPSHCVALRRILVTFRENLKNVMDAVVGRLDQAIRLSSLPFNRQTAKLLRLGPKMAPNSRVRSCRKHLVCMQLCEFLMDVHETDFANMPDAFKGDLNRTNHVTEAPIC